MSQQAAYPSRGRSRALVVLKQQCWVIAALACVWLLAGCASPAAPSSGRPFRFEQDTLAFPNQLLWEYSYDAHGHWSGHTRSPKPDYAHRCFVVARTARQFFYHARFAESEPKAGLEDYRKLICKVVSRNPRKRAPEHKRVVIPGYSNLRSFSADFEAIFKEECGGAWESYFQRGHWRMVFPFSRRHQAKTAEAMLADLKSNRPPVLHIVTFPKLTINHAVVAYEARETDTEIRFTTYDPNNSQHPVTLVFDRASRSFFWPTSDYFPGGKLNVYRVYHRWNY